jgi:hypothetical protein
MSANKKQKLILRIKSVILLFLAFTGVCFGQSNWEWRNPLPQGNDLNSVSFGNSRLVAVGDLGAIVSSSDGLTWEIRTSGTMKPLFSITFGNGLFVAVGDSGTILTSSDSGGTWKIKTSGAKEQLSSVTFGDGLFVAVGDSGTILISPDGATWTIKTSGTKAYLFSVAYGSSSSGGQTGQFIAVGKGIILNSSNGATWTVENSNVAATLHSVAYGNGEFVAVGQDLDLDGGSNDRATILRSNDGKNWSIQYLDSISSYFSYVNYCNNQFVASGNGSIFLTSFNGTTWTINSSPNWFSTEIFIQNLASSHVGQYVAVGFHGTIMTSPDDSTWTLRTSGPTVNLNSVTYGNGLFMASGSGMILTSLDGTTWSAKSPSDTIATLTAYTYSSMAFCNSQFVDIGYHGTIWTSANGDTWVRKNSGTYADISSMTYGDNLFVAVGNGGTILTSIDGITWTVKNAGISVLLTSVVYGNGLFVAVGDSGTILTSPDGTVWTIKNSNMKGELNCVTFGSNVLSGQAGRFVAVGADWPFHNGIGAGNGAILSSSDGTTWTMNSTGTPGHLLSVTYGNKQFVAVSYGRTIFTSSDGATWKIINPTPYGSDGWLTSVTYAKNLFVAVGSDGTILTSKADPTGIVFQPSVKNGISGLKLNVANKYISVTLPYATIRSQWSVRLYTISGKQIYSASSKISNRILNIPTKGFPTGKYFMSITDDYNRTLTSTVVLIR